MKNFLRLNLAICAIGAFQTALAGSLPEALANKARATLSDIDNAVNTAVARAESIYENLGTNGVDITAATGYAANLLTGVDPYLQHLKIANDGLKIQLQFVASASVGQKANTANYKEPVLGQLLGKRIIIVPIYNYTSNTQRDDKISTFECLTDADEGLSTFLNDAGLVAGRNSFISDYSDNKYLGKCKYLPTSDLDAYWIAS